MSNKGEGACRVEISPELTRCSRRALHKDVIDATQHIRREQKEKATSTLENQDMFYVEEGLMVAEVTDSSTRLKHVWMGSIRLQTGVRFPLLHASDSRRVDFGWV